MRSCSQPNRAAADRSGAHQRPRGRPGGRPFPFRYQPWSNTMTSEEVEALRESHKPARVGVLLIGESPPASGGFVYDAAPSMLQRAIKAAMAEIIGAEASFHDGLKA